MEDQSTGPNHPDRESEQHALGPRSDEQDRISRRALGPPVKISTFRDALGLAMLLADEYAFLRAAALLHQDGTVQELLTVDGFGSSIGSLVGQVCIRLHRPPGGISSVVLLTIGPMEDGIIRESDLGQFRRARWAVSASGADLVDWIETDGDLARSYASITCPALAWPQDPPEQRHQTW